MKLATIKSKLKSVSSSLPALPVARPAVVERRRGSGGVRDRDRIRNRDHGLCQNCGHLGRDVDHDVPLWAGGADSDDAKRVLCGECHEAKTKLEAAQRACGAYNRDAVQELLRALERKRRPNGIDPDCLFRSDVSPR